MKKVLILVSKQPTDPQGLSWHGLSGWVKKLLGEDYEVEVNALNKLVYMVGKKTAIYEASGKYDIADFDLVVLRTVGSELERGIAVAHYLKTKGVPFSDPYLLSIGKGKMASSFLRWANNLPVPQTLYASADQLVQVVKDQSVLSFPMILKADTGKKGNDNFLVKSPKELAAKLAAAKAKNIDMIAQEFITNDGDYRIVVMGGTPMFAMLRKGGAKTHLNNTSKGGSATKVSLRDLPERFIQLAVTAAELDKLDVAGVDLITDKQTGKDYILEVNRAPQLPTGAYADDKMAAYAEYIRRAIANSEDQSGLKVIGRVEKVSFPELGIKNVHAKVDSGADLSSLWATDIREQNGILKFKLFGKSSPHYTGKEIEIPPAHYLLTRIANSFGHKEFRYVVKLQIKLDGRLLLATFTLSNRGKKTYPILIGRKLLKGKFLVDVAKGSPLKNVEKVKKDRMKEELEIFRIWEKKV